MDKRHDILTVVHQGMRSVNKILNNQRRGKLMVCKGATDPRNSIEVEIDDRTAKKRDTALLFIEFADGTQWSGSFDDLKQIVVDARSLVQG